MKGATRFYQIILQAERRKLGNLRRLSLKYRWNGGDSEAFINGNVIYVTASHARGNTFHIYLIDDVNKTDDELKSNAFEVYGVIGGNPGWDEEYGWKYGGGLCSLCLYGDCSDLSDYPFFCDGGEY
jgi:hypothetical protein